MAIRVADYTSLPRDVIELLEAAKGVAPRSYNRYSRYLVGAAVQTVTGERFVGCFYENVSYGLTICAEPAAILAANTAGHRQLTAIAIVGGPSGDDSQTDVCTPCGRCRQILLEAATLSGRAIDVYCSDLKLSAVLVATSEELLPFGFGLGPASAN
jgi:cytidine deaminase